ncbi:MAG: copper oxidase [Mesorhizobium sp.]|uniref:cupredoxin domain-containing protein n=1 Tax=Mesorhizobium sp. TaxID=1871066 RepID=UPI000FE6BEA9|nr:cupredoxin family protein [Mesorhizobium sp.]RWH71725.1 MAG: copper oxidase [Mesorhizobium sp.]RWH85616.1 MAG: copper oxidase [Mesorhizobium sp.]RWH90872.1 MAG: copper oxidase [Mesorhizobium sp.]RWH99962.1 MAG: copper oxidase [Mesorhizobium sp.]RWI22247.1 MAG: copper oxidase [Mesorhizobium sp.]
MKRILAAAVLMAVSSGIAFATGNHAGGHGEEAGTIAIGKPGKAAQAKRVVNIAMSEKEDGSMVFEPAVLKVKEGETVRLKFTNKGETDHEFVMDTTEGVMEHKVLMEKFPEMEHSDPNSIRLAPGAKGEIIWTFAKAGDFTFACLIPGHYDAGMKGDITVAH